MKAQFYHSDSDPVERVGYIWPASALTNRDMAALARWREQTGKPISHLLSECVSIVDEIISGKHPLIRKEAAK